MINVIILTFADALILHKLNLREMKEELFANSSPAKWLRIALLNLTLVATLGLVTRYKLTYSLPQLDFKNLLHAHSHFAFAGWVSTALIALLVAFFVDSNTQESKKYRLLYYANQLTAIGMLISFLIGGYGPVSIGFSVCSIIVSYFYAWNLWKDTSHLKHLLSVVTLRFALSCLVVSSLATYALAYMKVAGIMDLRYYNNAVYFYLHFQYNGWFMFSVLSLALRMIGLKAGSETASHFKTPLKILMWMCLPAFFVSMLWIDPPFWVFAVAGAASLIQIAALFLIFLNGFKFREKLKPVFSNKGSVLLIFSLIAFSTKIVLQFFCIFPELNRFVFGHRPVIVGYLHLVLIGFISFYIIGIAIRLKVLSLDSLWNKAGLVLFITGFFVTEICCVLQGLADMIDYSFRWTNPTLFGAAIAMFTGISLFAYSQKWRMWSKSHTGVNVNLPRILQETEG